MKRSKGFTLIELMMGLLILVVFFVVVYRLFEGGTRNSEKVRWITTTTGQLKIATEKLTKLLNTSSYPTTLLADALRENFDAKWDVKILASKSKVAKPGDSGGPVKIMEWVVSEAERPPQKGKVTHYTLKFETNHYTKASLGTVILETKSGDYGTSGPKFAEAGVNPAFGAPVSTTLIADVASISFFVPTAIPTETRTPMKVLISCKNAMDPNTHKEIDFLVTPNVKIRNL